MGMIDDAEALGRAAVEDARAGIGVIGILANPAGSAVALAAAARARAQASLDAQYQRAGQRAGDAAIARARAAAPDIGRRIGAGAKQAAGGWVIVMAAGLGALLAIGVGRR